MSQNVFQIKSAFVNNNQPALDWLLSLAEQQGILAVDYHFASFIVSQVQTEDEKKCNLVALLGAKLSNQIAQQNTCIRIEQFEVEAAFTAKMPGTLLLPNKTEWIDVLLELNLATKFDTFDEINTTNKPFVLFNGILYLQKYFYFDVAVAQRLRVNSQTGIFNTTSSENQIDKLLDELFEFVDNNEPDLQMLAVKQSLTSPFCLITGGPGTGKTTTVLKLLAAQQMLQAQMGLPPLKQVLLAPTGKAAQRLSESLQGSKQKLMVPDHIKNLIPDRSATIHRFLNGILRQNDSVLIKPKVDADVILIDEASMVDINLMAKLLKYTNGNTQIVLLGDEQQLASVEAGNLLADFAAVNYGCTISRLTKSYRFDDHSEIGRLASAIKSGDAKKVSECLTSGRDQVEWFSPNTNDYAKLIDQIAEHYIGLRDLSQQPDNIPNILKELQKLQVLCFTRNGPMGINMINTHVEKRLSQRLKTPCIEHYHCRPIMIIENAYHLELYNGDIGIELKEPQTGILHAYFKNERGEITKISTQRLPKHETVYAMTVHKAQGSEFNKVVMFLPDKNSHNLSREVLYTGLTRAKSQFIVYGPLSIIQQSVTKKITRVSGLATLVNSE